MWSKKRLITPYKRRLVFSVMLRRGTFFYNSLDVVISNMVIACQGTKGIKNRRSVLILEYEDFEAKPNESVNFLYDMFVNPLNELALGREYSN